MGMGIMWVWVWVEDLDTHTHTHTHEVGMNPIWGGQHVTPRVGMNPIVGGSACDVIDRLHMPTTQPLRDTVDNLIKKNSDTQKLILRSDETTVPSTPCKLPNPLLSESQNDRQG